MRDIIVKRITPQTFCALAPIMPVMTSQEEGQAGRKIARTSRATASYADVFLRVLGIDITFGREGRAGTRVIRIRTKPENTVSTVSIVRDNDHDPRSSQPPPGPVDAARDDSHRPASTAADDADGADAKAAFQYR
jgi:hypothetical protein